MATGLKEAVWAKVAFASVGCSVAGAATNPIDVIKIRLQLQGELRAAASSGEPPVYRGFVRGVWYVARHEGLRGLFKGVLPSVYREASYSGLRLGLYDPIKALYGDTNAPGLSMSLWKKLASGATAGAIAGAITNPLDLVKVRLVVARVFLLLASRDARAHRSLTTPSRAGAHAGSRRAGAVPLGLARRARDRAHSGLHWPVPRTLALSHYGCLLSPVCNTRLSRAGSRVWCRLGLRRESGPTCSEPCWSASRSLLPTTRPSTA